jgi:protein gp37
MADKSAIEWTEVTWNPTTGCDRVSSGCDGCYAPTQAKSLAQTLIKRARTL